jgi:hypothetical protein
MQRSAITAVILVAAWSPVTAAAQSQVYSDLQAVYSLWGFMDTVGRVCSELNGNDTSYTVALEQWQARNAPIRAEVDDFLSASGEDRGLVAAAEERAGSDIEAGLRAASTPATPCATWLSNLSKGSYEPELNVEQPLARLRSPDGD